MLWNIHGEKYNMPVEISTSGNNIIIPAIPKGEIFIHELVFNPSATVTATIKCGTKEQRKIVLGTQQGWVSNDIVGMQGEPIFKCLPNEDFIINLSSAVPVSGGITYSYKNNE